ncbi:MAG: hypothetical protein DBX47_02975 [Clostridiales bacterium]|nr:MAG: hypothetical protein DBX47_02975 [Clostridiales bacterium]
MKIHIFLLSLTLISLVLTACSNSEVFSKETGDNKNLEETVLDLRLKTDELYKENSVSGEEIVLYNNNIYYSAQESEVGLFKVCKGQTPEKIYDKNVFDIIIKNETIYCCEYFSMERFGLMKINLDGTEYVSYCPENSSQFSLTMLNEELYYLENSYSQNSSIYNDDCDFSRSLRCLNLISGEVTTVIEDVGSYKISAKKIYFTTLDSRNILLTGCNESPEIIVEKTSSKITDFYVYNGILYYGCSLNLVALELSDKKVLSTEVGSEVCNFFVYDGCLYYTCIGVDGCCVMSFDGVTVKSHVKVFKDTEYAIFNDCIYYINRENLFCKYDINNTKEVVVFPLVWFNYTITEKNLYFFKRTGDNITICSFDTAGSLCEF